MPLPVPAGGGGGGGGRGGGRAGGGQLSVCCVDIMKHGGEGALTLRQGHSQLLQEINTVSSCLLRLDLWSSLLFVTSTH